MFGGRVSELVNHLDLYRLPWNLADNAISWLEPTAQCNLACDGCYRFNRKEHKSWERTLQELDTFQRLRRFDSMSIAGGDPLLYPDLVRTVEEVRRRGLKPIVNTNGLALKHSLLQDLKQAGVAGFTFHVDSKQGRPGKWRGKDEIELCHLRDELAEKAASIDAACSFNATVYPDTLQYVPALTNWAERRMDVVDTMVYILYRDMPTQDFRFFSGADELHDMAQPGARPDNATAKQKGESGQLVYNLDREREFDDYVTADDCIAAIRQVQPDYQPSAYLNGTQDPSSFKWLLSMRIGRPGHTYGFVGPKFMEAVQSGHHLATGRYLAYVRPELMRRGELALLLSAVDPRTRDIAAKVVRDALLHPRSAASDPLCLQSILVIQPIDVMADGRMNMCDGCPDMTVWNDELVWSCRMDEQERYGGNLTAVPNVAAQQDAAAE